jgi:chaperonin GroES
MRKSTMQPLADRVLVKADPAEEKSKGGIIIPDTGGTVLAAGKGKKDEAMTVQVVDSIVYGKYAGTEITVDGVAALIMKESDIFGIFK